LPLLKFQPSYLSNLDTNWNISSL